MTRNRDSHSEYFKLGLGEAVRRRNAHKNQTIYRDSQTLEDYQLVLSNFVPKVPKAPKVINDFHLEDT
jgi:hypothetical protein